MNVIPPRRKLSFFSSNGSVLPNIKTLLCVWVCKGSLAVAWETLNSERDASHYLFPSLHGSHTKKDGAVGIRTPRPSWECAPPSPLLHCGGGRGKGCADCPGHGNHSLPSPEGRRALEKEFWLISVAGVELSMPLTIFVCFLINTCYSLGGYDKKNTYSWAICTV